MRRPQNRVSPASPWPRPCPDMPPPRTLLSPFFSRREFPAAAAAAAVSEHPCVSLLEWWLERVEGDDRKLAVGGVFERNQEIQDFSPAPIAKRHESCVLETEDGIIVYIYGSLNIRRMVGSGFEIKICEEFLLGFPYWWEDCNLLYPKKMSMNTGSEPDSSNTSNSQGDSTRFYLEKFQLGTFVDSLSPSLISNPLNNAKGFSGNDADAFRNSSHLPNGEPRFEEYTSDDGIPTNERAAASNDDTERYSSVCNEVDNVEIDFIEGSTLGERGHGDIDTNVSLAPTVECTHDEANGEGGNTPHKSKVASLSRDCREKPQSIALTEKAVPDENMPTSACSYVQSPEKPVGPSKEKRSVHEKLQGAIRSPTIVTPVAYARESPLTRDRANSLSMSTPESLKLRKTRSGRAVVPTLNRGCQRIVYDWDGSISGVVGLDSPPPPKGSTLNTYARKKKRTH